MKVYAIEFKYTLVREDRAEQVNRADRVVRYMDGAFNDRPLQEQFWVIFLNRRNYAMGRHRVTMGTLCGTLVALREVFRPAILAGAAAIICVHNHPSGDPARSAADLQLNRQLIDAAKAVDIPLLDNVIIGEQLQDPLNVGFYSFREGGLL